MKIPLRKLSLLLLAVLAVGTARANVILIDNWDFETPNVNGHLAYRPAGAGWNFTLLTGVAANGSGFNVANAAGNQAGFIQNDQFNSSLLSQDLSGFISANFYTVRFIAQGRNSGVGTNPLNVFLGGNLLTFTYDNSTIVQPVSGTIFYSYESVPITGLSGTQTLAFQGITQIYDQTTFIDNVQVFSPGDVVAGPFGPAAVPEPSALSLIILGLSGVAAVRRRFSLNKAPCDGSKQQNR